MDCSLDTWQLHIGTRLAKSGIITLPRYHSTLAYLKWTLDSSPNLNSSEPYIYIEYLFVSPELRRQGLGTRLLHILCTANDKNPVPRNILLVTTAPSLGEFYALEEWYKRRGFVTGIIDEYLVRRQGDSRIHAVVSQWDKYNSTSTATPT